jgi:ribonuclease VapC
VIVDSSTLIAVIQREEDAVALADVLVGTETCFISAANYFEAAIVADKERNPVTSRRFDELCASIELKVVPVDEAQARIAREAYRDFGKGSGHKARLNFGDCFAYALAKAMNEPLLYKGTDFSQTDVRPAL